MMIVLCMLVSLFILESFELMVAVVRLSFISVSPVEVDFFYASHGLTSFSARFDASFIIYPHIMRLSSDFAKKETKIQKMSLKRILYALYYMLSLIPPAEGGVL